jgi:hypothetical protein
MASVCHELVWGFLVTNKALTIALVGSGLQLSMCAAFLAEKLQFLKPVIVAIQQPEGEHDSHFSFAFPPFAEPAVPLLRLGLSESSLQQVRIFTPASPSGFAFNFSPYGVVSDAITFQHAYQVCRQHEVDFPGYDSFLALTPPPSAGFLYKRQSFRAEYQFSAVGRGVIYVPTEQVVVSLSNNAQRILSVQTSAGQVLTADYFIDCSSDGVLMQHLQKRVSLSEDIIPPWSVINRQGSDAGATTAAELKFEGSQVSCVGVLDGERRERIYDLRGSTPLEYFPQPWLGNCVAMGSGFAAIPEFLVDLDRLLERQLVTLSWLIGVNSETSSSARHFNMLSMRDLGEIIDMANLLLYASLDQPLSLSPSNSRRVGLFRSSANTIEENNSLISENGWTGLLHAGGYTPRNVNAVSAAADPQKIVDRTKSLLSR